MPYKVVKGKKIKWYHFSKLKEGDFTFLQKEFKFHPLDFDDLREEVELPKVDVYKYYVFAVFVIPTLNKEQNRVDKRNLSVFIGKDYLVTITSESIPAVDRLFSRATRNRGLRNESLSKSSGFFLYKLLDYVFRDVDVTLQELTRETHATEALVYDQRTEVTTKRLGVLRSNILFFSHLIDPQRILISHLIHVRKTFLSKELDVYFDDIKDTLDAQWIVAGNLRSIIESLFSVNEAFLTHRTNKIIRILTIISVVLMPPTLVTSYYGMNVQGLPFADNILVATGFVVLPLILFLIVIFYLDKKR